MSAGPTPSTESLDLPPRPVAPEPSDCCGGGCARCVFDLYEEELQRWERQVARGQPTNG